MKWPETTQIAGCRIFVCRGGTSLPPAAFRNECPQKHAYSSKPSRVSSETSRCPAFSTHLGISTLEPLSEDRTAITSPTAASRMARMSSISGPGQKLPRASTVRVMAAVSVMAVTTPFGVSGG
mgnify:CR=1 FL=1